MNKLDNLYKEEEASSLNIQVQSELNVPWWHPSRGYFGSFYMDGENLKGTEQTLDEKTKAEVSGIINLLELAHGARILDMPCGYGRHSIELANVNIDHFLPSKDEKHSTPRPLVSGHTLVVNDLYNPNTRRLEGSWTINNGKEEIKKTYSVRLYTQEEYISLCNNIGLKLNFMVIGVNLHIQKRVCILL